MRSGLFQLSLDLLGLVLADAFFDRLRYAVDQCFCIFEPEAGNGPNFFDDLNLLVSVGRQDNVEFGLFLGRGTAAFNEA